MELIQKSAMVFEHFMESIKAIFDTVGTSFRSDNPRLIFTAWPNGVTQDRKTHPTPCCH